MKGQSAVIVVLSTLFIASAVQAQEGETGATPGVGELTEGPSNVSTALDVGVGFSKLGEDYFTDLNLGFTISYERLELGFLVPLRLRVIDEDPENADTIREADWDEASDYMRILRFVQYGNRHDTFYVRAGELSGIMLGHGTIVNGYNNNVDINHFQWGINTALNLRHGGFELLLDNMVDPEIFGTRAYIRPWEFIDPESYWTRFAAGISLVGDFHAPAVLLLADDGRYVFDNEDNLAVAEHESTVILGFDLELQAYTDDLVSLTPYTDLNVHIGQGTGWHLGNLANFTLSDAVALNTRFEFRVLGAGYLPDYIDGLYEVERFLFQPIPDDFPGQRRPKLRWLESVELDSMLGWLGEATLALMDMLYLTLGYEDYEGDNNSGALGRLALPALGPVTLGAYYVNQGFDGIAEVFKLDNALIVTEARVNIAGPFYGILQFARRFSATEDGEYEPVDDWGIGFGMSFSF